MGLGNPWDMIWFFEEIERKRKKKNLDHDDEEEELDEWRRKRRIL
jgi:hypothetical protein